ncbi:MAG: Ldh family oxidoreductase [Bulleidia sp.]|nr:Ldh family oxidoreductase [Bulleidia sp.]
MKFAYDSLLRFGTEVLVAAGFEEEEARIQTDAMLFADARGIHSHGMSRLINYSKRVECGVMSAGQNVEVISESESAVAFDGHNGVGPKIARQALERCMEKATKTGCCVATVRHGNHFGAGAYYTKYAADHNMIALVLSNSEAAVTPWGGSKPMLGTNPISLGIPAGNGDSFNMDMATSVVARGKVVLAQKEGKSIPEGWAVDKNGKMTTDPNAVLDGGCMLPFGGPKGYAISLAIDLLASCLGGALNCRETHHFWTDYENPQDVGYFMVVIDPTKLRPADEFFPAVQKEFSVFRNAPTAAGVKQVLIPGDIEAHNQEKSMDEGVELTDAVVEELRELGKKYNVSENI